MSHRLALLPLALGACREDDTTTAPTDSATDTGPRLIETAYTGVVLGKEEDTCGERFVYEVAPGVLSAEPEPGDEIPQIVVSTGVANLAYTGDDRFTLTYGPGSVQRCQLDDGEVTCKGYDAVASPFTLRSRVEELVVTSERSFTQRERVEWSCVGGVCADFGDFPCTMVVSERFDAPLSEAGYCFDNWDNDLDGAWDAGDADCPRFLPEFWSVTGEFAYDADAGGVVPFVLAGVEHRPTVTIRIHGALYQNGFAYPSANPAQICTITLTTTGREPIPMGIEDVPGSDGAPAERRHTFRPPADRVEMTTTCPAQGLFGTESWGTLADVAALGWGLGVGAPGVVDPRAPDALGAAARFGVADAWVSFGTAGGWVVDAEGRVLDAGGAVADPADVAADALQILPAADVTASGPLPSAAYVITSASALRYGG